ncbi:hypothetical protein RRG08_014901 [Elysia crispata]|uniref:Uncharacterized protein n=1 Tax=Elysia crispata TaxID=231223 RepID=A0AAE1DI77_9GAST|nr:hypothetical protein RRG08_014901 [Elysia crispata]
MPPKEVALGDQMIQCPGRAKPAFFIHLASRLDTHTAASVPCRQQLQQQRVCLMGRDASTRYCASAF